MEVDTSNDFQACVERVPSVCTCTCASCMYTVDWRGGVAYLENHISKLVLRVQHGLSRHILENPHEHGNELFEEGAVLRSVYILQRLTYLPNKLKLLQNGCTWRYTRTHIHRRAVIQMSTFIIEFALRRQSTHIYIYTRRNAR